MLHPIPESPHRHRLLAVFELQRQLMEALCALPVRAVVDLPWLQGVWAALDADWVRRFWENDSGRRQQWITTLAAASKADKTTLRQLAGEQWRYSELYATPPTVRLTRHSWRNEPFAAANELLKSFYAPLFRKHEGFPNPDGTRFHKDHFTEPPPRICPYTDTHVQDTNLDHFLPQDEFPMLSMHPDNLVPCGTDPNSIRHKGKRLPLDPNAPDQAAAWFHPRHRSAIGTYRLGFPDQPAPHPRVEFLALSPENQPRLDNLENLFDLSDFWGRMLDDELQLIAGEIRDDLNETGDTPTEVLVVQRLQRAAQRMERRIGRDALAIVKSAFYTHISNTPALLNQVMRVCTHGT